MNGIDTNPETADKGQQQVTPTKHDLEEEEYNKIEIEENKPRDNDAENIKNTYEDNETPPELSDEGEDA